MKVKVDQYIKEVLRQTGSVVVGDLGKFYTEYKSAELDEETHVLKPPTELIHFDSKSVVDAGILVKFIAKIENIAEDIVKKEVVKFVDETKAKLNKGQNQQVDQLGFLYLDENKILFENNQSSDLSLDSFGLMPVKMGTDKSYRHFDASLISEVKDTPEVKRRLALKITLVLIPILLLSGVLFLQMPEGKEYKDQLSELTQEYTDIEFTLPSFEQSDEVIEESDESIENQTITQAETVINKGESIKTEQKNFIVDRQISKNEENLLPQGVPVYHLIIGSFKNESNAVTVQKQYQDKGYKPVVLPVDAGLIRLSLKQFTNFQQAIDATNQYNDDHTDESVWIFVAKNELTVRYYFHF